MNKDDVMELCEIAIDAGKEIMEVYSGDFSTTVKDDSSPLTEADLRSNKLICSRIADKFGGIPILSEENKKAGYELRKEWSSCFLIDPLDGTKEFINRNGEFTVNIAYIEGGVPVCGIVYAPAIDMLYFSDGKKSSLRTGSDEKIIHVSEAKTPLRVVASKSHFNEATKDYIETITTDYELVNKGSSLKICLVADGSADIYPRIAPTMEWDTAAAHAVIKTAGGEIYNFETGMPIIYNKQELKNPPFIAEIKRDI